MNEPKTETTWGTTRIEKTEVKIKVTVQDHEDYNSDQDWIEIAKKVQMPEELKKSLDGANYLGARIDLATEISPDGSGTTNVYFTFEKEIKS